MRTWLIIGAVAVLGGGTVLVRTFGGGEGDYAIDVAMIDTGPLTMTVETLGTVQPLSTVTVGCETTGKIIEIMVDDDDPVTQDQIICRIDPELVEAAHAQSVADLTRAKSAALEAEISEREQAAALPVATAQAQGRLQESKANLLAEEYNWTRVDRLYKEGNATEAEWTAAKARFEGAQATVKIAEAAHDQAKLNEEFLPKRSRQAVEQAKAAEKLAEARFASTKAQVNRCVIHSPIDGIVLKRYMDVGATVNAVYQTPPLFLIAPGLDRMRVNAKVSESDIVHIDVGQEARFLVEGKQRIEFEGVILHKRNQPEMVQGVTTYTVILEVDNDERRTLLPGMSVNVEIQCVHRSEALRLSNKALRFKPPIDLTLRQSMIDALEWPAAPHGADGKPALYSKRDHAWRFDRQSRTWSAAPLWIGVTDNVSTEVLWGGQAGDVFVTEFIDQSSSGFSLKEAIKLARPDNRTL